MALTLKWWTDLKTNNEYKVNGKTAPETEFEKKLKVYDTARKTLDSTKTSANCNAAVKNLANVEAVRKASKTALDTAGFKKLGAVLTPSVTSNESAALEKVKDSLDVAQLQAHAHTPEEGVYETLWSAYEKQREKEKAQPTKTLYANMVASLTKLEDQAGKAGQSSPHLLSKYNKLSSGLAAEKTRVTNAQTTYNNAIQRAIQVRQQLLPSFNQLTAVLAQAGQTLTGLKAQALTAQQTNNSFMLNKVLKDAKAAAGPALTQWDQVSATFAPSSPIRTSGDIKAANIALEDSQELIVAHFDALNQINKTNLAHKKTIDTLMAEIEAVKIVQGARQ